MKYSSLLLLSIALAGICAPRVATADFPMQDAIVIERVKSAENIEPQAGQQDVDFTQDPIYKVLQSKSVAGRDIKNLGALRDFYLAHAFEPYWTYSGSFGSSGLNNDGEDLVDIIEDSWTHGLNPLSYHLEKIRALQADESDEALAQLDVLLSDAYVRYGRDMTGIRVNPAAFRSHKRYWKNAMEAADLLALLEDDVDDAVYAFSPKGQTYKKLREALISLVEYGPEAYESVLPLRMSGLLKPQEEHKIVPDLRVRLGISGASNNFHYDDQLTSAVMRFQRDHNLHADGIVGPSTLEALNQSRMGKIKQLVANLERLRWVDESKPEKFVVVNIPSAMLWAIDDGRVQFEMPVIVGRKARATNIFVTDITGVRFNPTWTVPPTIKKEDIVPKLIENPLYLTNKGMELLYGSGRDAMTLDPASIDWETISEEELKSLRMVQMSGSHNPLGTIRVLMPNGYNIYLHDTNEPAYFDRPGRAASSGCIRLKDPERMAQFILENKSGWTKEMYEAAFESSSMKDVFISEVIPIYLVYYTAWVGDNGAVVYSNDLYGYDDALVKMLSDIDGFLIPVDNNDNRAQSSGHSTLVSVK